MYNTVQNYGNPLFFAFIFLCASILNKLTQDVKVKHKIDMKGLFEFYTILELIRKGFR